LTAAGFTYDVADDGTAGGAVLNLNSVNFSNYSALGSRADFSKFKRARRKLEAYRHELPMRP